MSRFSLDLMPSTRLGVTGLLVTAALISAQPGHAATTCNVEVGYSPEGTAEGLVLTAIHDARSSIRLAAYSFSAPAIARELVDARRRGVDVAIVVDQKESHAKSQQAALNLVVNAGIPTRTISAYAIHHDKYMVIDGTTVETGSFNYSSAASRRNSENALLLSGCPALARSYLAHWQSRWDQANTYSSSY